MKVDKNEAVQEVGRPLLRPLGIAQGACIIAFVASPFIWIWSGWEMAWKTGLSGLIGVVICYVLHSSVKKVASQFIDESVERMNEVEKSKGGVKSRFQQRLNQ